MTTTAKRPSAARKHTRTTETNRADANEQGLKITLEGEVYEVRLGDVTSNLTRELRRGTGISFNQLMREVTTDPDVDSIAGFVWLARRIAGERVEIEDVVVTYTQLLGDDFEVALPESRAGGDDPEA
jgi:hypothetical protein